MKSLASCTFIFIFILNLTALSQVESIQSGADFKDASKIGRAQSGYESLQSHSSGIVNGSQFFYPTWAKGTITATNQTVSYNYLLLLDNVRQELFMKIKDSATILVADKSQLKSFTISTDKIHYFISAPLFDPTKKDGFFEILINGGTGYSLLKMVKSKFVKANEHDMDKIKMGENYDAFEDEVTYYISLNNLIPQKVTLKEKIIKKVLVTQKTKVDQFFTQNNENPLDEVFLVNLILAVN